MIDLLYEGNKAPNRRRVRMKTTKPTQATINAMLSSADASVITAKTALNAVAWAFAQAGIDNDAIAKAIAAVAELSVTVNLEISHADAEARARIDATAKAIKAHAKAIKASRVEAGA